MRALITGASAGIGEALARLFAADGHDVVLVARRRERLEALAAELREAHDIEAEVLACDLAEPGAAGALFERAEQAGLEEVDFLVNNAGLGQNGAFSEADPGLLTTMMRVNMEALTLLTRAFLPGMLERDRGRILNVGSTAGFQPGPGMAVYYATKAFVYSFTDALVEELRGTGVTVTNLAPGATETEFQVHAEMEQTLLFAAGVMSAEQVAQAGYEGMMRGKSLVIPGASNKLTSWGVPFLPRALTRRIVRRINDSR